jgi:predicted transcriptional regulator
MSSHPNRSTWRRGNRPPTPEEIRASREAAGLTQEAAASLAGLSCQPRWAEYEAGRKRPSSTLWELWLLRVDQHPTHRMTPRTPSSTN